jgi:Cu/Ag efflux protein CusF
MAMETDSKMRTRENNLNFPSFLACALLVLQIAACALLNGCSSSPKPAAEQSSAQQGTVRYPLQGRVVAVEQDKEQVVVAHGDIPGFMMAMTMAYAVKDPKLLDSLSPDDQITADVVQDRDNKSDYWLENIVVVKKTAQSSAPAQAQPGKQ